MNLKLSISFWLFIVGLGCEAQSLPMTSVNHNNGNYIDNLFTPQPSNNNINLADVGGSPYYNNAFVPATIVLKSGKKFEDILVKFDLFSNEVLFKQNNVELVLQSVWKVYHYDIPGDTTSNRTLFQAGFPPIEKKTSSTIYKVEAGGNNVYLLNHYSKKLMEIYNGYSKLKKFENEEKWYIYSSDGGIQNVKLNKKQIETFFSKEVQKVQSLVSEHHLNLNKKGDIIQLINLLDRL